MELDNKLPKEEDQNFKYFEVLTDGFHFWVSVTDMQDICTQISVSQLESIGVKLNTEIVFGEAYVNVNDEFLIYVQKNTSKPKYIPTLGLLATKNGDYNYENVDNLETGMSL